MASLVLHARRRVTLGFFLPTTKRWARSTPFFFVRSVPDFFKQLLRKPVLCFFFSIQLSLLCTWTIAVMVPLFWVGPFQPPFIFSPGLREVQSWVEKFPYAPVLNLPR